MHSVIRDRIALLVYAPGARLKEMELASEFNVSRSPIRRVLQRLEYEGLVVARHGVGNIVTDVDVQGLRKVYLFRMKLAELTGDLGTPAVPGDIVPTLKQLGSRCEELYGQGTAQDFGRVNMDLHEQFLRFIDNEHLRETNDILFYQTARMWLRLMPELNWNKEVRQLHRDILLFAEAAEMNDVRGVGFIMRNALATVLARFAQYMPAS